MLIPIESLPQITDVNTVNAILTHFRERGMQSGSISDGYHTFDELYEHRIVNYIALCNQLSDNPYHLVWKSKAHSDGSIWDGWFILGIDKEPGKQITYHLPMYKWDDIHPDEVLEKAPEWDGHTSADVLERLKSL